MDKTDDLELLEGGNPWDRQPGESVHDFARFEAYRLGGPDRSVRAAFRTSKGTKKEATKAWYALAERNKWKDRAEAWDLFAIARERREFEEARRASRNSRIKVLEGFLDRVVDASLVLDPKAARWTDVTDALATIVKALRDEFGETTKTQTEVTGAIGAGVQFVAVMPAPAEGADEWAKQAKATTGEK